MKKFSRGSKYILILLVPMPGRGKEHWHQGCYTRKESMCEAIDHFPIKPYKNILPENMHKCMNGHWYNFCFFPFFV